MVLYNPTPNSLEPDAHTVPTIHLDSGAGERVVNYAADARNPTVSFEVGNTSGVFDGDIDAFIESGIRWKRSAEREEA